MRGDTQVSITISKLEVRRDKNPTPIIEPVILLPTVAVATLEETSLDKILVEQAQGEDANNHSSRASVGER